MPLNAARVRQCLKDFDFRALFIQELGWDRHAGSVVANVDATNYLLQPIAEKRGFQVFECPASDDGRVPDYPTRSKIDRQVSRSAHEHIIVYTDAAKTVQKWQWVRRELGRPLARREYDFFKGHTGELLAQKLQYLAVDLSEEEDLTLVDVTRRARQAFDVDRVTRRFYDRFKTEHAAFLGFIKGITATGDAEWYASLMLNRLMFVYFIQKKGFLDGDPDYLRNRMQRVRQQKGKDKFLTFYRYFLLRLFHEGLGQPPPQRKKDLDSLLGQVPYLNGGLFDVHQLERTYPDIHVADDAFERLFDFFDAYQWHLDERPLRADNEINPDVLGYIFEKYINQKQMGAYYTKEDITGYIARNTLIPFLFDAAEKKCAIAFQPEGALWRLLRDDPDRYIYPAVRKGVDFPLPPAVVDGVADYAKRRGWNLPATEEYALPTETWREHMARRQRCTELRAKLQAGEVHDVNDLITYNLDICQFAEDVIENCEGPDLLRAFWQSIEKVSVLDPACGSGAFLFAALNILEPLYEACLDRMQSFLEDLDRSAGKHHPDKFSDFRKVLQEVARHPNRCYFILKSIVVKNLYGVDIMEEAVEICKLRLFLKLVAQVDKVKQIEPLPDIDFNIRPGNTLVGFATLQDVRETMKDRLSFDEDAVQLILDDAREAEEAFAAFRGYQTEFGSENVDCSGAKARLQRKLAILRDLLDRYLASDYGLDQERQLQEFERWRLSHQPFHWLAEYYGIVSEGGFDVIIGNPPYVELNALTQYGTIGYSCESAGNLYALFIERGQTICNRSGRQGFIVPVSSISTDRYDSLQALLARRPVHYSSYDDRPSRLFDGLEHIRLTIHLMGQAEATPCLVSTRYNKWNAEERASLFDRLRYATASRVLVDGSMPKLGSEIERGILDRLVAERARLAEFYSRSSAHRIYYSRKVGYFLQVLDFEPQVLDGRGNRRPPSEFKELRFRSDLHAKLALGCLNSHLFYWFITVFSDCRHVNKREVDAFPLDLNRLAASVHAKNLASAAKRLMTDLDTKSEERRMRFRHDTLTVQCIVPKNSKSIIDDIDRVLAKHFDFTDEELDFIFNYDIKYRMGQEEGELE